jgi:hypothetical protein
LRCTVASYRDDIQNNDAVSQYLMRKVWTDCTGVCLLCSYRPKPAKNFSNTGTSTPSTVVSRASRASSQASTDLMGFLDIPIVDFLTFVVWWVVFPGVSLHAVDNAAVRALVNEIFELYMITNIDEGVYEKLFDLSAGNPLYTTELAKGIAQKRAILMDTSTSIPSLANLLTEMRTMRVEEVVYYRFDQLDAEWQTVLKLAAVASSHGAPFNVSMLQKMLTEEKHFRKQVRADFDLSAVLNRMLATNEFIYLKNVSPFVPIVDRGDAHQEFDAEVLGTLHMCWSIAMEQRAIYELLLDEQKQSLHNIMVSMQQLHSSSSRVLIEISSALQFQVDYLTKNNTEPTSHTLTELAHHQDRGHHFAQAMRCYYDAGMQLHGKGDNHDALKLFSSALRMLSKLRHSAGVSDEEHGWRACSPSKMQEVFCGDMSMAEVAVNATLRLAQCLFVYAQQSGVNEEITKLARRNALTFFEQAHCMIQAAEGDAVPFAKLNGLFWECYESGELRGPENTHSLARGN